MFPDILFELSKLRLTIFQQGIRLFLQGTQEKFWARKKNSLVESDDLFLMPRLFDP